MSNTSKGKKLSEEHRRKIGLVNKGKVRPVESRLKMSEVKKGKKHSLETRQKMSIAAIKRICNNPNKNPIFSNTAPERQLKEIFIKNDIKFTHQYFMEDIKHQYAADFYLPDYNCIVEADGKYWHKYPHGKDIDHIRTKEMKDKGYTVLRFWEGQISEEDAIEKISNLNR